MSKCIIDNKIYDTEKAHKIVEYTRYRLNLFGVETIEVKGILYKTQKDNWFSVYADNRTGRPYVIVKTEDEVKKILKDENAFELYEKYFGKLDEA